MLLVRVKAGVSGTIVAGVARAPGQVVARVEGLPRAVAILGTGPHLEIVEEATDTVVPWPPAPVVEVLPAAPTPDAALEEPPLSLAMEALPEPPSAASEQPDPDSNHPPRGRRRRS